MTPTPVDATAAEHGGLLLSLFLVFGAAKVAAEVFERLRQPAVVGEILAGVLIGPSALGWVAPSEASRALAEIGVILLLFTVGLEVSPRAIFAVGRRALLVASAGVVLPFAAGWGFMRLWGAPTIEAVFVAAALVATSVGITARVLAGMGRLDRASSQIILGAAVIDDILGLIVLSGVSSLASGDVRYGEVALSAALSIGFTLFVLLAGPRVARAVTPLAASLRVGNGLFVFALVACLGLSALATELRVAPIVGAFLAGMALSDVGRETSLEREVGSVMEFLVPFFLVGIGLQLDVAVFRDPYVLLLAAIVTVLAVVTKFVGCGLAALPLGPRAAAQVGLGMVPRGEVGIIVAQIGLGLGVLSSAVYGVVVFMAVATTLVAPPLLVFAFAREGGGESTAEQDVVERHRTFSTID